MVTEVREELGSNQKLVRQVEISHCTKPLQAGWKGKCSPHRASGGGRHGSRGARMQSGTPLAYVGRGGRGRRFLHLAPPSPSPETLVLPIGGSHLMRNPGSAACRGQDS